MRQRQAQFDVGLGENIRRFFSQYDRHLKKKHWLKYRLSLTQRRQRAIGIHMIFAFIPIMAFIYDSMEFFLTKVHPVAWWGWLYLFLIPVFIIDIALWRYSPLMVFRVRWQLFAWYESATADRKRGTDEGDDTFTPKALKHPEFCYWWDFDSFYIQVFQLHSLQPQAIEQLQSSLSYKLFPKGQMTPTEPTELNGSVLFRYEAPFHRKVVHE